MLLPVSRIQVANGRRNESTLELDARFTHLVQLGDRLVVVSDDDSVVLDLPAAADVLRLLDGTRTAVGITAELADRHAPELVHFVLLALEHRRIARPAVRTGPGKHGKERPHGEEERALARRLRLAWNGRRSARLIRLPVTGRAGESVGLVLTDDYLDPKLDSLDVPGPTLLARIGAERLWAGPLFTPGAGPCPSCLRERLMLNLEDRARLHLDLAGRDGAVVRRIARAIPFAAFLRLAVTLHDILDAVAAGASPAEIRVLDVHDIGHEAHPVSRLPQCNACGEPSRSPPGASVVLRSRAIHGHARGGHRALSPDDALRRLARHVSPFTGVVQRARRVPVDGTDLIHVYTARHALHHRSAALRTVKSARRDPAGGKGRTDVDARLSALGEALERFSAVCRGNERLRVARSSQLAGLAIEPNAVQLYSESQFAQREATNPLDASGFQHVPEPYEDQPIEWTEARSLVTGEVRFVPASSVYLGFHGSSRRYARGDSNGLAGGNCLEEAILQAFLELVERDAVALWWYNRIQRPALDLASFDDPWLEQMKTYYTSIGRTFWALDITTDFGFPCFAALSHRLDEARQDIIFGFGCHLDAAIAVSRAVTELNQMLPTVLRSPEERRRQLLPEFQDAIRWWDAASLASHPHLVAAESVPSIASQWPAPLSRDLRENVQNCVNRARAANFDVLVHDLTRPDVGYSVARVIVPGLRHFWRRLAPGRLYHTPVHLGWTDRARNENEMNPVSMFV